MNDRVTEVIEVNPGDFDVRQLDPARRALCADRLVAFPTETVYGLGARALSEEAVRRIFEAKQRPATNPLILHVASIEQARSLAGSWPDEADALARAFWPGPLTLVVKRSDKVPDQVCAGLDTVAFRIPDHPIARALIEATGEPLAAPSANRHTTVSPTTADHVLATLEGRVDVVVDGGPTAVGIESTLISAVESPPVILRPGAIDRRTLGAVVHIAGRPARPEVVDEEKARPSPGLSKRHYSPGVCLRTVDPTTFRRLVAGDDQRRAFIGLGADSHTRSAPGERMLRLPDDPRRYARRLYAALHRLDALDIDEIVVQRPPKGDLWEAIHDRLMRAAASDEAEGY